MGNYRERYIRETRDEYGYYPNWPVCSPLELGQVGYFNGRRAEFHWHTSLKRLGVPFAAQLGFPGFTDLRADQGNVQFEFGFDGAPGVARALFTFHRKMAYATQGHGIQISRLDTNAVSNELISRINAGTLKWDPNWVVTTEIAEGDSFTTLISGKSGGQISLSASPTGSSPEFNIADVNASVAVRSAKWMSYKGIAEKRAIPFFQICNLVYRDARPVYLRRRGAESLLSGGGGI